MNEPHFDYVILELQPDSDVEKFAGQLSEYGKLGFKVINVTSQGTFILYTLELQTLRER